jgi:DNA invertase Pin-like site-specific DNA recombinase
MTKCALYCRVSTDEQTTENQIPQLEKFANDRGWQIVKIYTENESAWKAGHQRELSNAIVAASNHQFDYLLIWALDRLTRQGISTIWGLVNTFEKYNVHVVSLQEKFLQDIDDGFRPLYLSFLAWQAKFESDRKSARIKAALDRRRALGLPVGRIKGAKDKIDRPRKRTGYLLRYADRRPNKLPPKNEGSAASGKQDTNIQ